MSDAVLSVRNATKSFGARRALDGVSLEVARGEMIALIGPSGSGKSTLLRSISGLQTIDGGAGRIEAFGAAVQENGRISGRVRESRIRIGFIFQQFNLVGRLSLFTNVALGSLGRIPAWKGLLGLWPAETKTAVMAALARVGVADYAAQRANTLSGGQQQRGAIARALVQKAKIVLADEPVASLDPVAARKVMENLRDLNRQDGLTVVVTLHQVDYAMRYCDRVIALKAGKIVYDGPAGSLEKPKLIDIYGPEFEDVFWEGAPDMIRRRLLGAMGLVAALSLAACNQKPEPTVQTNEIVFGILPAENQASMGPLWQPLLDDMAKQVGVKITPRFVSNYAGLIEAMRFKQVQMGWFSALPALDAVTRSDGEVLGRVIDAGGDATYKSVLIVKKGSGITLEKVLACGQKYSFGIGDPQSTSGTLAPMAYLFTPKAIDPTSCFKTVRSSSHQANSAAVATGVLDVATNNTVGLLFAKRETPKIGNALDVVWTSPPLPESSIIVRKDVDPAIKEKMRQFFLTYGAGTGPDADRQRQVLKGLAYGGFRAADDTYLDPVREMQAAVALAEARKSGDKASIDKAQAEFDKIHAVAEQKRAKEPAI